MITNAPRFIRLSYPAPVTLFLIGWLIPLMLAAEPACVTLDDAATFGPSTELIFEIGGLRACADYDQLILSDRLTLRDASVKVEFLNAFIPSVGDEFMVMAVGSSVSGRFQQGNQLTTTNGTVFSIDYAGGDGNDIVLTTLVAGSVLPVEMRSFGGASVKEEVHLWWTTEGERDNDFFTVERSVSTMTADFTPLFNVASRGDNQRLQSYAGVDENPLRGINYYRLRQTDYDGTTTIFPRILAIAYTDVALRVSPHPAYDETKIYVPADLGDGPVPVLLYGPNGKLLRQWQQRPGTESAVSVGDLPSGVYQLAAGKGTGAVSMQLVIVAR